MNEVPQIICGEMNNPSLITDILEVDISLFDSTGELMEKNS
jgi:hypothetical protein